MKQYECYEIGREKEEVAIIVEALSEKLAASTYAQTLDNNCIECVTDDRTIMVKLHSTEDKNTRFRAYDVEVKVEYVYKARRSTVVTTHVTVPVTTPVEEAK